MFKKVEHEKGDKTIEDGEYKIVYAKDQKKTVYIAPNTNAELKTDFNTLRNRFYISYLGDGYYKIKVLQTGKCLDVAGGEMSNGTNVREWEDNGADAQKWIIRQNEDGTYRIISKCNDLNLDVFGGQTADGTNVNMYENNGAEAQKFMFKKVEHEKGDKTIEDGIYKISFARDEKKVISINQSNAVIMYDKTQRYQTFNIKYVENGYYTIQSIDSNKFLDVQGGGMTNGTNVREWEENGADAQKWIIRENEDGTYSIISKCNDLFLDICGGNTDNMTNVNMYEKNNSIAQKFLIKKTIPHVINDGIYEISSSLNPNLVIDIAGASNANMANADLWQRLDQNQQKFIITYVEDDYYTIQNVKSYKMLDVSNGGQDDKTNVQQYEKNNADAQLWKIISDGNGKYSFISKCNSLYLTTATKNVTNGTNLYMYHQISGGRQWFYINKTEQREYLGIDVSSHQKGIDWNAVKNSGIHFVIIRCGYGKNDTAQDDTEFFRNISECERLGIPYGIYLYSYALTEGDAYSEADHALRLLRGHNPEFGVWIDMEDADQYKLRHGMPSNQTLVNICDIFCTQISNNGYKAGIYASLSWLNFQLNDGRLDKYDKWVAQWNNVCTYNKPFSLWQYTSKGQVDGISGNVDMNKAFR